MGQRQTLVLVLLAAFVLPVFLFPTLHHVHEYYNLENGIFLIAAVAAILSSFPPRPRLILTGAIVILQVTTFWYVYAGLKGDEFARAKGKEIASHIPNPMDAIVIYGMEWDPMIPYYAGRRAIMETTLASLDQVIDRAKAMFDPRHSYHVGAVIRCPCIWDGYPKYEAIFQPLGLPRSNGCQIRYFQSSSR